MTRIYTNVAAMTARSSLNQNLSALETSLQRLSTGLRINSGKDDPAGLIASEILRSEMTGIKTAISNTERANMMIATADSALNEVTSLLNDIRGLVTEAANTGAMSAEMIAANQLQVDASLDAIDRIAAQTTFMGQKLLDGSLDFDKTGVDRNNIQNLNVHQVTFGSDGANVDVNVTVQQAAEKAALYYNNPAIADNIVLTWGGNYGYSTQTFDRGATVGEIARVVNASSNSTGVVAEVGSDAIAGTITTSSLGANNDIIITAGSAGGNTGDIEIKYHKGTSEGIKIEYQEPIDSKSPGILNVYLQTEAYKNAEANEVDITPGANDNNALKFVANIAGSQYNDANIHFVDGNLTQAAWGDALTNPYGVANHQYAYYNDDPTVSKALFGDINGVSSFTELEDDEYFTIQSKVGSSAYNNTEILFLFDESGEVPSGKAAWARYVEVTDDDTGDITKQLRIYYKEGTSFQQIQDALKVEGTFELVPSDSGVLTKTLTEGDSYDTEGDPFDPADPTTIPQGYSNTHNSGGEAGTLFIVLPPNSMDPDDDPISANDIVDMFDITNPASRGSERAANLFTVTRTTDNDGNGLMALYQYNSDKVDENGDPIVMDSKSAYNKAFKDGVTGGDVITTAAELVTAMNNSAYWGMTMCPEMIAELAQYNAQGTYYDAASPPVITAKLSPGNVGSGVVSAFEEVAYYGNPNEGTGIQFLGEENSPNIRFVAEPGNSELWIDYTTVPDKVDFASAVLTAQNSRASMVITANKKGEDYDDVQFVFKRASENPNNDPTAPDPTLDPNRRKGWVEYDPATSYAEAEATFKSTDGHMIANSAFYVTSNERGDVFNDVPVMMSMSDSQSDAVVITFDDASGQLRISLNSAMVGPPGVDPDDPLWYKQIDTNDVVAAINNADVGFTAGLSYSDDQRSAYTYDYDAQEWIANIDLDPDTIPATNNGTGTFDHLGLRLNQLTEIANTESTGGHQGGTVTVWLSDYEEIDPDSGETVWRQPNANDAALLINQDQVVGKMFNARTYSSDTTSGTGEIDFVKDGPIVTSGGLVERGALTVHLVTDKNGLVQTTAKDLVEWWDQQDPETVSNISASLVRPAGAVWDECNDPYGYGLLEPTVSIGECDEEIVNDIQFVGWNDDIEKQYYVPSYATGTMTSDNGINSSYQLIARQAGPDYNDYTIVYVNDETVSGYYKDNYVEGSDTNPCDDDPYSGLPSNDCGELIVPSTTTENGMKLLFDESTKTITIHLREGITTAYDIEQLIENDAQTKNKFQVVQKGDGSGVVSLQDDTLLTKDGSLAPGELNGAKLLFGSDASEYFLIFKSTEYGSDQFVDVQATGRDGSTTFSLTDKNGKVAEKVYGEDVQALINGVQAVGDGLNASLNTSTLSLDLTLSEEAGTSTDYATSFSITGGGATYQIGPQVVTSQQISIGIPSVNTVKLGGASGKLYQLRSGQDASLTADTNKAYRIVEEAILSITTTRGRLGTIQAATFETNINVLNDTLEAITEAESQIRDTDFAEETSNMTRAQILVQSSLSALGIANQIPNYMLSLLQ